MQRLLNIENALKGFAGFCIKNSYTGVANAEIYHLDFI